MKIEGFQKCKVHSSSLKGFRITDCQNWCKFAPAGICTWDLTILKPFKLEEFILDFWKPSIFINLVLAGQDHTYVLNTQKAFLKIASFITVYLVGVNSQTHTTVDIVYTSI